MWYALIGAVVAIVFADRMVRPGSTYSTMLRSLVLIGAACGFLGFWLPRAGIIGLIAVGLCALVIGFLGRLDRGNDTQRWLANAGHPVILSLPFEGEWQVISANEHGCDFVRVDAESWQSSILAPCDGLVAHVEDGHDDAMPHTGPSRDRKAPLGNYVSIETARGYVVLAHLERGSMQVRAGANVHTGSILAQCGNSGTTRGAQFHVHAQNRALVDPDLAHTIPIAFVAPGSPEPMLYEEGDRVTTVAPQ